MAPQHDVGAATRHVGGDSDGTCRPACATISLRARAAWRSHFRQLSVTMPGQHSEFSMEVVPTSTGLPARMTILMSRRSHRLFLEVNT
jgi:hypothetical protein